MDAGDLLEGGDESVLGGMDDAEPSNYTLGEEGEEGGEEDEEEEVVYRALAAFISYIM